jgi:FkbM family methyltransferase
MTKKNSRARKILFAALTLLAIPVLVLAFAHINRPATVRAYFWLEQKWVDHWPVQSQKWEIEKLAPFMIRLGILGPTRVEVEPGVSFLLDPRDLIGVSILRGGSWQPEIWDSMSPSLPVGGVFLDVGAHIGSFTMKAAVKVGKTGHVLAFEPNPETLQLLRDNVAASHADNVIVEPIACTDHEQMLTLYAGPPSNTGMSSLASENVPLEGPPRLYTVRGRMIDDVIRELKLTRVDVIKIDVEGAEAYVLRGAVDTLKRFHPKVIVEVVASQLAAMHSTPDDVAAVLKGAGYNHSRALNTPVTDWEWTVEPGANGH